MDKTLSLFQVADQVLTDQVQGIIYGLVKNFIESAANFSLGRPNPIRHLNGDLRALILVSSTRTEILTDNLLDALKTLKTRANSTMETIKAIEEADKSDDDEKQDEDKIEPPPAKKLKNREAEERSKLKDTVITFVHTLNLLINMCENALSTSSTTDAKNEEDQENHDMSKEDEQPDAEMSSETKDNDDKDNNDKQKTTQENEKS